MYIHFYWCDKDIFNQENKNSVFLLSFVCLQTKQRVDVLHLQLQNLLYEVMHLQKEIGKCLEFKYEEQLMLQIFGNISSSPTMEIND